MSNKMSNGFRAFHSSLFHLLGRSRVAIALVTVFAWTSGPSTPMLRAQTPQLTSLDIIGIPPFNPQLNVEYGYVNPATGNLHLEIPLGTFPQRGSKTVTLYLQYDSSYWSGSTTAFGASLRTLRWAGMGTGSNASGAVGWQFVTSGDASSGGYGAYTPDGNYCNIDGVESSDYYHDFSWADPSGTVHSFPIVTVWGNVNQCGDYTYLNQPNGSAYAVDSSGYFMSVTNFYFVSVYAPDGTLVFQDNNSENLQTPVDINGNHFSQSTSNNLTNLSKDNLGRNLVTQTVSGNTVTYAVPNSEGGTSSYIVTWEQINAATAFCPNGQTVFCKEYPQAGLVNPALSVIQSIQLPDGTFFRFGYDSGTTTGHYAQLTSMTIPTGAQISFTYANFIDATFPPDGGPGTHITRGVHTRTTPDGMWTYTPQVITQCTSSQPKNCVQQLTVTAPSGDNQVWTFNLNGGAWPTQVQFYNGGVAPTNLLATITKTYNYPAICAYTSYAFYITSCQPNEAIDVTVASETVTLATSTAAVVNRTTQYQVDHNQCSATNYPCQGNVTQIQEWNFYSGSLPASADRTTTIAYLSDSNSTYLAKNLIHLKTSVVTTDKNGNTISKTLYCYDYIGGCGGSSFTSITGVAQHDDTNFGANDTVRGNLTQIQRLLSGTANYVTTSRTYDSTGQSTTSTDGNGNVTQFSYVDNFFKDVGDNSSPVSYTPPSPTNAYLKSLTQGSLATTFGYYWGTGQIALSTDPNNQTTYKHYYDSLSRQTSTKMPDGGWIFLQYNSNETQIDKGTGITGNTLTTSCPTSSNACRHDQTLLDAMGRLIQTVLVSDADGATTAATAYDSNGRILKTSNPYRTTSDPTYGWITNTYDGLNRKIQMQRQDGSLYKTYYGSQVSSGGGATSQLCSSTTYGLGYPVLIVDEAGKKHQSWTNGFGNMIEADEPDSTGALTVPTCYSYDLINNLTGVLQNGSRQRTFTYDLLSRLTIATIPESGTSTYTYDGNGNMLTKTSPAPNQTGTATITATYAYDTHNRVTQKSYAGGTITTPTKNFVYDVSSIDRYTGLTNTAGRLVKASTNGTSPTATYYNYDALGQLKFQAQCAVINCYGNSGGLVPWQVSYSHDLAGDVASYTDPGGTVFTQTFDAAERPTQLTSSWVDTNHPNTPLAKADASFGFYPNGAIRKITLGNGLTETAAYNNRFQPCRGDINTSSGYYTTCADSTPAGSLLDFAYGYNAGTSDNGNIATWSATGNLTFNRSYVYDNLNRLSTMADTASSQTCKGMSETYDAWGNRIGQTTTNGSCFQLAASANANNQLIDTVNGKYKYDATGNMTQDASHTYTFDAENHIVQVDGGATAVYLYDATGKRVMKNSGTSTFFIYGPANSIITERDSGNNWIQTYITFGGRLLGYYKSTATIYMYQDHLASTRLYTDVNGSPYGSALDYDPFGYLTAGSSGVDARKFSGKERDSESGLDNFDARYFGSSIGRFMSPDPLGGHRADPQTLNRYVYVRNNPLSLTDPTGLDFNLLCSARENSPTCQGGLQGTTTTTTDANGKQTSTFTPTVISNDKNGNLVDQNGNHYNATVSGAGVSFSQVGSDKPASMGVFINNSNPTTIQGRGGLAGFTFTFTYSNWAGNVTAGGTFSYKGTFQQAESALENAGFHHYATDEYDIFHPSTLSYHAADFRSAGDPETGAGSGHFTVEEPWMFYYYDALRSPTDGDVHLGEHNDNTSRTGLIDHTGEVIRTIWWNYLVPK